jgi:preprotein translocase SecE subunit
VARDRKRAKQRKERQARSAGSARPGQAAARPEHLSHDEHLTHEHEPAELATGDGDIVDAQLALGRPELIDTTGAGVPDVVDDDVDLPQLADESDFEQLEDRVDDAEEAFEEHRNGNDGEGAVATRPRRTRTAAAPRDGNRFANFLRGSWRELQRVQWPDRRQVGQATAVVIGFVIVAGAFLGLADYVAGKIVDFII